MLYLIAACTVLRANALLPPLPVRRSSSALHAGGGPPQYDKIDATLVANEVVGRATNLLRLESDAPLDYKAGHVLALEVEKDDEWLRGPYTVTRATEKTFDVVIRVCGKKSEVMAASPVGSRWRFGGKFHVPILEGISDRARQGPKGHADGLVVLGGSRVSVRAGPKGTAGPEGPCGWLSSLRWI